MRYSGPSSVSTYSSRWASSPKLITLPGVFERRVTVGAATPVGIARTPPTQ